MASLTLKDRWFVVVPEWCGNRSGADPFTIKVARRKEGEVRAFESAVNALADRWMADPPNEDELFAVLDGFADGPFFAGELEVEGEKVAKGDLRALLRFAAVEPPWYDGGLFREICNLAIGVNVVSEQLAKNSERRRGGSPSTPTPTAA
jgi:hypothetical protein